VGNFIKSKNEILNYLQARTPLIIVNSLERERVETILYQVSSESNSKMYYYTDSRQVRTLDSKETVNADGDPISFCMNLFKRNRDSIFVYGDIKRISDDNSFSRDVLNLLYLATEMNCTLVIITADQVWSRISQFGMITTLEYPDYDERLNKILVFLEKYRHRYSVEWNLEDTKKASVMLHGFSEVQIDNILSTILMKRKGLFRSSIVELTQQKSRLYPPVVSISEINIDDDLTICGLGNLKKWLENKRKVFFADREELNYYDLKPIKGILLAGIPGCGKTMSAKMIATSWGLPLFRFDIASIFDKWLGESEKKMNAALKFLENVSPCVVLIDEIEKSFAVSDSGNDTGKRILGQFLYWLQESSSHVFLVATANDVGKLPIEMFRKGRFSEIFFLDLPNYHERKNTINYYLSRSVHLQLEEADLNSLALASEGFSYSDVEYAIKDIAQKLLTKEYETVDINVLFDSFINTYSISKSNPESIMKIRDWGLSRALSASVREE
jgi:hypothetical protein